MVIETGERGASAPCWLHDQTLRDRADVVCLGGLERCLAAEDGGPANAVGTVALGEDQLDEAVSVAGLVVAILDGNDLGAGGDRRRGGAGDVAEAAARGGGALQLGDERAAVGAELDHAKDALE